MNELSWLSSPLIPAVLGFFAGLVVQWLGHRFTQKREVQQYYIEVYQRLYAPILVDVFHYFDMRAHFRRGHDVSPEEEHEVYERIPVHIGNNLVYASPKLIASYHQMITKRRSDMTGFYPSFGHLDLFFTFLEELDLLVKQSSIFGKNQQKNADEVSHAIPHLDNISPEGARY